ncbi:DUF547 domain-containing protein [Flavivirga sp. 57AJ16]|uniref:DUF547 domain-containing protein n=1 Tax=Flavivirga sp. 57AJ16 TaxID=3025307 RepID=UPI0023665B0B|nr:DUF547 domain-containing protein [Flavivirga sp. 57AJ16]MDD7886913.1 DUF547 domain-containing protein [Flavivirga sp. 57AJ16]
MKHIGVLVLMYFGSLSLSAQDLNTFFEKADSFFKVYVADGKVAYSKINSNKESLHEVLKLAETISVSKDDAKNYQAFWINAYNLSVIKGIIDNYPTNSPLDHTGFFDKTTYNLAGKKITLNAIEHTLLRAQFNDARFHFVLVCGALGCPPLINRAYLPETLNSQMDAQTKQALNSSFLKVNTKKKRVRVSQIMAWYKKDFTMNGKTEIDFINGYRTEKIPDNFKLSYFPYNWNVNKQ